MGCKDEASDILQADSRVNNRNDLASRVVVCGISCSLLDLNCVSESRWSGPGSQLGSLRQVRLNCTTAARWWAGSLTRIRAADRQPVVSGLEKSRVPLIADDPGQAVGLALVFVFFAD